jgi:galactose mutarotase-like enzyme
MSTATQRSETEPFLLTSNDLRVLVSPDQGGRIVSLTHRGVAQDVLWRENAGADRPCYDASADVADIQGWEECCPAVGPGPYPPGPWEGIQNPVQGEVFALPWRVLEATGNRIALAVHGVRFPYLLQRELTVSEPDVLHLRYRIENHCGLPFPFIWSAHPLFDARGGARIVLPEGVSAVFVDSSLHDHLAPARRSVGWPQARLAEGETVAFTPVQPGAGVSHKLYAVALPDGWCRLERADGLTLDLRWDPAEIPCLGIWIDTVGAGMARVALEPCLGYPDALADAAQWGRHAVLPPFGERSWEVTLQVRSGR